MMPDLINYWLTGEKACEYTNATTTQLYDLDAEDWAWELTEAWASPSASSLRSSLPGRNSELCCRRCE